MLTSHVSFKNYLITNFPKGFQKRSIKKNLIESLYAMSVDEAPRLIAHNPLLDTEFKLTIYSLYK